MSMLQHSTRAWGSPSRYIQGRYELENMKTHTEVYGRRVFFLIDVFFFADYKKRFEALYAGSDSQIPVSYTQLCHRAGDRSCAPESGLYTAAQARPAATAERTPLPLSSTASTAPGGAGRKTRAAA